jgi:hypothetical protein
MDTEQVVNDFLTRWRSDLLDTAGEIALVKLVDRLLAEQRERCAQIAEGFIPSSFTGTGKLGNAFAVARDDRARTIAWCIRHQDTHASTSTKGTRAE